MGGSGGITNVLSTEGFGSLHEQSTSLFKEDTAANILLMGAPMGLKQTAAELGLSGESPEAPTAAPAQVMSDEEVQEQAKRARENELIRRRGTRGRASTIKTGSRGAGPNLQTTFKQLGGR
jgi:hypothetical protein